MTLAADLLGLHVLDWAVLLGYFLIILMVGIWSMRKVKDMSDFFMGGRRFGKVFMMFFAFGSGTSSEQAVSVHFDMASPGSGTSFCGSGRRRSTGLLRPCFDACGL